MVFTELQDAGLVPKALKRPRIDNGHKKKKRGDKHPKKLKKMSQANIPKGRKDKKVVQSNYNMEEDFPRGGNRDALKKSRKTRAQGTFGLPANGGQAEILQVPLKTAKKRKKKRRKNTSGSSPRDESLFLIKQRKKKSKQKQKQKQKPNL